MAPIDNHSQRHRILLAERNKMKSKECAHLFDDHLREAPVRRHERVLPGDLQLVKEDADLLAKVFGVRDVRLLRSLSILSTLSTLVDESKKASSSSQTTPRSNEEFGSVSSWKTKLWSDVARVAAHPRVESSNPSFSLNSCW